jgi:putative hemolysin
VARTAHVVPDTAEALEILSTLRSAEVPMALVHDEYGHFEGLVTPTDLAGAIVGGFRPDEDPGDEQSAVQREDGSYQTVAGFLLEAMKRLPQVGEAVEVDGWRFEVVDLDGRRIDKVLAAPVEAGTVLATHRPGTGPPVR